MEDQRTNREDGKVPGARRFRISLKTSLLILTLVAILVGGASELFRASERAERRARARDVLRNTRGLYETVTGLLKRDIETDPANASKYEAKLKQADEDLKEVERRCNELMK